MRCEFEPGESKPAEAPFLRAFDEHQTLLIGLWHRRHLCGHRHIFKRLVVHAASFNLGLLMRTLVGGRKPWRPQVGVPALALARRGLVTLVTSVWNHDRPRVRRIPGLTTDYCGSLSSGGFSSRHGHWRRTTREPES